MQIYDVNSNYIFLIGIAIEKAILFLVGNDTIIEKWEPIHDGISDVIMFLSEND